MAKSEWTIGKGNGGTKRRESWLDDTASLRKTLLKGAVCCSKAELTRTAAVAAVQSESGEVMVDKKAVEDC